MMGRMVGNLQRWFFFRSLFQFHHHQLWFILKEKVSSSVNSCLGEKFFEQCSWNGFKEMMQ